MGEKDITEEFKNYLLDANKSIYVGGRFQQIEDVLEENLDTDYLESFQHAMSKRYRPNQSVLFYTLSGTLQTIPAESNTCWTLKNTGNTSIDIGDVLYAFPPNSRYNSINNKFYSRTLMRDVYAPIIMNRRDIEKTLKEILKGKAKDTWANDDLMEKGLITIFKVISAMEPIGTVYRSCSNRLDISIKPNETFILMTNPQSS